MARAAWRVAGASVTGAYHAISGEPCQDRHRLQVTPGDALIAVVSDGAGSARHAGEGATILCESVSAALAGFAGRGKLKPSRALLRRAYRAVCDGVEAARRRILDAMPPEASLYDYHATLVGAFVLPGSGGLFFHIGDGAALAVSGERWLLSPPSNGEYSNETYFFTQANWRRHLRFKLIEPGFDTIFVMSDGVTDLSFRHNGHGPEPFMPFFEPIGRFLSTTKRDEAERALGATLDTPAARERSDDDKTLVWAQFAA
ncbi:PP2C family serine/threonine-protein phosphatase [Sphingomonas sp.]|uniref:PP2C family serine/threonine-protein phosphatase n=1 Tax=Sphingomonas sp. TaxID=28214 RepID=UPI001B06303C|nr:PP2C family serine/threonine-protein phosphatase [Sphingomonas sp.]MBO9713845.1 protein phosphatase 2C domain-containing protein [Sphingomonas sp.]